ncbi:MAG: sodium/proline symporter [bacterium]
MNFVFLLATLVYISILISVGVFFYFKQKNAADFMVGSRSLNFWVTAIATHATDMSAWIFMALPGLVYRQGLFEAFWIAVGLVICMFLTWQFIAPKIRIMTEKEDAPTLPAYFERRFNDTSGVLRTLSACICVLFFTFYISSGIVALGNTIEMAFSLSYFLGIFLGTFVMALYTVLGGFVAIAWNHFVKGVLILTVLFIVPIFGWIKVGGMSKIFTAVQNKGISLAIIPDYSLSTVGAILVALFSWGIGYFGIPHVLVNFMGIDDAKNMKKSQYLGTAWQILILSFALIVGLIGIAFFADKELVNSELVFVGMAKSLFPPLIAGLAFCAVLAAAMSTMDSQILVSASTIAEDLYKRFFDKKISSKKLLIVSQIAGVVITLISFFIAFFNRETRILDLVQYAWSGLGASFGPLVITAFYATWATRQGAIAGVLVGAISAAVWPHFNLPLAHAQIIPAFLLSFAAIWIVSMISKSHFVFRKQSQ